MCHLTAHFKPENEWVAAPASPAFARPAKRDHLLFYSVGGARLRLQTEASAKELVCLAQPLQLCFRIGHFLRKRITSSLEAWCIYKVVLSAARDERCMHSRILAAREDFWPMFMSQPYLSY